MADNKIQRPLTQQTRSSAQSVKVNGPELSARLYTLRWKDVKIFLFSVINANFCFVSDVGLRDENRTESVRQVCGRGSLRVRASLFAVTRKIPDKVSVTATWIWKHVEIRQISLEGLERALSYSRVSRASKEHELLFPQVCLSWRTALRLCQLDWSVTAIHQTLLTWHRI
jgi:hypothetical protein